MKLIVDIKINGLHCIDDEGNRCKFLWYGYPFSKDSCEVFKTKQGDNRAINGNPPRRCNQCLESETK